MSQPFDKEALRRIKVPQWVQESNGVGYCMSVWPEELRARAAKAGVTISEFGFVDTTCVLYDSQYLKQKHPTLDEASRREGIEDYRRHGFRILAVYPPGLVGELYAAHPEWRKISNNTTEIPDVDTAQNPTGGPLCLLGPYGDRMIDILVEILTKFPEVDAFSFDGLHHGGVCYCRHCRENYRNDSGLEIPTVNMDDPAFRRYLHWADRRLEQLIVRMQTRLKTIKPEVALITWTTNAGRFGHLLDIPRNMPARMNLLLDAPDQEFWLDETNRGLSIVPAFANAYIWAQTDYRTSFSEAYLMSHGNPYGKDSFPSHEIERRLMLAITYGVEPSLALAQPRNMVEGTLAAYEKATRRRPWMTHKTPEKWAAMVMSDNTRVFYGRSSGWVEERYLANVFGFFRTAVEAHLPVNLINDWNLNAEDLDGYKVLILPNTACLDESQLAAVREFVNNGGGLVASVDASLFNEFGDPRENFALADVFGADYRGVTASSDAADPNLDVNFARAIGPDYWEKRKNVFDLRRTAGSAIDSPKLSEYIGEDPVVFKGQAVAVVPRAGAQAVGTITPRSAGASHYPAAIVNQFGKGRVVYLPAGIDSAYYLYPYPYHRLILIAAIEHAARAPAPISVHAPMCVHARLYRQRKDGERLIIHLFNDLNTTGGHAHPRDDVPLREESVPIHDIRINLRGYNVTTAALQPQNEPIKVVPTEGGCEIVVPRLDIHTMIVAELAR